MTRRSTLFLTVRALDGRDHYRIWSVCHFFVGSLASSRQEPAGCWRSQGRPKTLTRTPKNQIYVDIRHRWI